MSRKDERLLRRLIREELGSGERAIVYLGEVGTGPTYIIAYDIGELERSLQDDRVPYNGVIAGLYVKPAGADGPCNATWHVATAASNEKGWGTRVYLAAFDLVRRLSPDRWGVSKAAEATWKSLARRFNLEMEPFDDKIRPKTPPPDDDCKIFVTRDPAVNASYRLSGGVPSEIHDLVTRGVDHLREFWDRGEHETAESLLRLGFTDLFRNVYDG